MSLTVVVPLDGSPLAERALPYAGLFVRQPNVRLVVIRIVPGSQVGDLIDPEHRERLLLEARNYLTGLVPEARAGGLAGAVTYYGDPASLILDEATAQQADLIVMSTHGRSGWGQWIYGSVAGSILHDSTIPVLLVSPRCRPPRAPLEGARILVPHDGSSLASAIVQPAIDLARQLGGEIRLVKVVGPSSFITMDDVPDFADLPIEVTDVPEATGMLDAIAERMHLQDVSASVQVLQSRDPVESILEAAHSWKADLIAMATHGHGGLARLVTGSVTQGIVQKADLPVLALRPAALVAPSPTEARAVVSA